MRLIATSLVGALMLALAPALASAQARESVEPFALGTFNIDGQATVGLVLREQLIVELNRANRSLEIDPAYVRLTMPEDMLQLIGQYEYGLKYRLYEIVNHLVESGQLTAGERPSFDHSVEDVRFLAPDARLSIME